MPSESQGTTKIKGQNFSNVFFVAADGDVQICASIANKYDLCPSKYEHNSDRSLQKVHTFVKPRIGGVSKMTRAQVNEMCWVVRHHIPKKPVSSKYFNKREINHSFWLKYAKSMRVVDKGSNAFVDSKL